MESLYFLLALFFIIILFIPLNFRIKGVLNIQSGWLLISIFLWKIKIIFLRLLIKDKTIYITTKKKKKEIQISLSQKQIYFVEQLIENLKNKVQPRKISIYSKIGTFNAAQTALICGSIVAIFKSLFCFVKNKKPTCSMSIHTAPCFNKKVFLICVYSGLTITLFDLIFSLIISLFSLRRMEYERRNKQSKFS